MKSRSFLSKLLFGQGDHLDANNVIRRQVDTVKKIWNNSNYKDFGLERIVRLIIGLLPFMDVGLYLRNIFTGKNKGLHRKVLTDLYALANCLFPLLILLFGWYPCKWIIYAAIYFSFETFMALLSMIFLRPEIPSPISNNRNLINVSSTKYKCLKIW